MRLLLLANPKSGRGRSARHVAELTAGLRAAGHELDIREPGPELSRCELTERLRRVDLLVIAGGDGSVHHAAPAAIETGTPIFHYPLGTENLFARHFGICRDPALLEIAILRKKIVAIDVGDCNGRMFVLMMSIGFDAHVVDRVCAARRSGVRRADYLKHAAAELRSLRLSPLTVDADGRAVCTGEPGQVVIANCAEYAAGLNPCPDARADDGLLDVAFLPYRSRVELTAWVCRLGLGMHDSAGGAHRARARSCRVRLGCPEGRRVAVQMDGEAVEMGRGPLDLQVSVRPGALRVLTS